MYTLIYDGGKPDKLIKFLDGKTALSYGRLLSLLRRGEIRINQKKVYENSALAKGDLISVYADAAPPLSIVYEDENILAAYKRKGIKTDGDDGFFGEITSVEKYKNLILCHRLDTNTDGIVLFAKTAACERAVIAAFKEHAVEKKYIALVCGLFKEPNGIKTAYLAKDENEGEAEVRGRYFDGSREIKTRFDVIRTLPGRNLTLLDITLITGKTHQIRAHLKYLGYFIAGDGKYGDEKTNRLLKISKQQLTAYKIAFKAGESSPLKYLNQKTIELSDPESFIRFPTQPAQ
ncbi:MAG: RluA family pseudouridine synthase [Clostridiales bacterium]|jgi:23S rRNA pseudouridine955/2504/2580 synthase|nr:RluA family pseudouridine synthase [Clostridiales bacterium]